MRLRIFITTSNKNMHCLGPMSYLFNRFWSDQQEVTVVGYDHPKFNLPENFKFVSMGKQEGGPARWATDLRKFFESIDDEFIIHGLEDYFFYEPVDLDLLELLIENHLAENVGRIGLSKGPSRRDHKVLKSYEDFDLIALEQDAEYRIAYQFCIWNSQFLIDYLVPGYTPWQCELLGSEKAKEDLRLVLATKKRYATKYSWALRNKRHAEYDYGPLDPAIICEMEEKGLIIEEMLQSNVRQRELNNRSLWKMLAAKILK